jgi:hypothetical protein
MTQPDRMQTQLTQLVVKDRVRLGLLPAEQQALALALAWQGLPDGISWTEPEVNAELKRCLGGTLRCLDIDHVELRRWLVDAGWLARDDWGRAYRRVARGELRPASQSWAAVVADALAGQPAAAWAAAQRAAKQAERDARRSRWQQQQSQEAGALAA